MDFTYVSMLKIWSILADTKTDINIGSSLVVKTVVNTNYVYDGDDVDS